MKPINSQWQMVKFWKFAEKLTVSQCHMFLKCKMCNEKETYIGKKLGENTKRFKVRTNQHISDCKAGVSVCKFLRHV